MDNETMNTAAPIAAETTDTPAATRASATWVGPMDTLRALLTHAGERDVRFYLNGVCLDTTGPAPVFVATDGARGVAWHDCRVRRAGTGRPVLELRGTALEVATALGADRWHVSISQDAGVAVAVVVLEASR